MASDQPPLVKVIVLEWLPNAVKWLGVSSCVLFVLFVLAEGCGLSVYKEVGMGSHQLAVTVLAASGEPIRSASAEAVNSLREAEPIRDEAVPPETRRWSAIQDPYVGAPLVVVVPTSHRATGLLWKREWRSQFQHLVVVIERADGKREAKLVGIPDLRTTNEITVEFP